MKNIHQIYISDGMHVPNVYVQGQMQKLREMYSDYNYTLYDNDMCRTEIASVFGNVAVKLYDSLNSYSFRADLARYCILYKYGGHYFDAVICPEFKLEFKDSPVLYQAPDSDDAVCNNLIDNGVMYFNGCNHPFLRDAIARSLSNIKRQSYGVHPLDITGPLMLSRLPQYDISFGKSKYITPTQKGAFFHNELHWLYKPEGTTFASFSGNGTNSYEQMWFDKQIFKNTHAL
jgi:mannosyltransferase OCH1-like enzyme